MGAADTLSVPIFRSVDQALHVAFLMDVLPVRERSQMGRIIARMMVEAGVTAGRSEAGSVNFGGLSPLEVRGQCAMIRAAVKDHLAQHHTCAVWARWGHQTTKAEGVRGMVDYCGPLLSVGHGEARIAMGWAIYGTEAQKRGINGAEIARGWSLNERAVQRDIATIRKTARAVESAALDALAQVFCGGVVE